MTPNEQFDHQVKRDVQARAREGVKAILEEVLEEEILEDVEGAAEQAVPELLNEELAGAAHARVADAKLYVGIRS